MHHRAHHHLRVLARLNQAPTFGPVSHHNHNTKAHQCPLYFLITTEQDRTIPLRTVAALCRESPATTHPTSASSSKGLSLIIPRPMKAQQPTTPAPPSTRRKTIAPLRPGLALLFLVYGCCMPLSQAFLPSHHGQGDSRARSLLGPSSPSPGSSLPLGRKAGLPMYSMLDKGGNKRRRPRRQGNGNEGDDEEEEEEEYRAMRPAALDRVRPPPPPRVRPGNCKMGLWREGIHGCGFRG